MEERENGGKKYTNFYKSKDGEDLVEVLIEFCKASGYAYAKSPDFFQVDVYQRYQYMCDALLGQH